MKFLWRIRRHKYGDKTWNGIMLAAVQEMAGDGSYDNAEIEAMDVRHKMPGDGIGPMRTTITIELRH